MAVMGVALAASPIPHGDEVRSFKDDLSKLLVGAVYILAVATVDLELIRDLWPRGFLVILGLMVVVRPIAVWISAYRSDLSWRERTYIGLIGPRGIVAAAIAAFAGDALGPEAGGDVLTALVFLTVFLTVAVQSTYAGRMADLLGVKAMRAIIAGAGSVARRVGRGLADDGYDVTLMDLDRDAIGRARAGATRRERGEDRGRRDGQRSGEPAVLPVPERPRPRGRAVRPRLAAGRGRGVPLGRDPRRQLARGAITGAAGADRRAADHGGALARKWRTGDDQRAGRQWPARPARARPRSAGAGARAADPTPG